MAELLVGFLCFAAAVILVIKVFAWLARAGRPKARPTSTPTFTVTIRTETEPTYRRADDARWFAPGETTTIAGYAIPGGFLYVGRHLNAVNELRAVEPALINPELPVAPSSVDWSGEAMTYWPSYSEIRSDCRAAFLRWLADGRKHPTVGIGYVFLFFYGLERRLLHDGGRGDLPAGERETIAGEVERLLDLYGGQPSFRRYAADFLAVARILAGTKRLSDSAPPSIDSSWEIPLAIRVGLAEIVAEGRPIPPQWALAWLRFHPETRLRTPAQRCPAEFEHLFESRYRQRFGEGIVVKPNRTKLVVRYKPASASFGGSVGVPLRDLTDVTALTAPVQKLRELADGCLGDLEAYSRLLGRDPQARGTVAAIALLPADLASSDVSPEADQVFQLVRGRLLDRDVAIVEAKEILDCWATANADGRLVKAEAVILAQFLHKSGYGFEPDVRFGGRVPKASEKLVLFRLPADAPAAPSSQFRSATALLQMAVLVAQADGRVDPAEESRLVAHLESALHLDPAERARLRAHLQWEMANHSTLADVKKKVTHLDPAKRETLGQFLVGVAAADGRLDRNEVEVLTKLYGLLGLPEDDLFRDLHSLGMPDSRDAGVSASARPVRALTLDPARVQAKIAESAVVAALLQNIFADDETPVAPAILSGATGPSFTGLDSAHSAFVRELAGQPTWLRADLESRAARVGLLPDGALEVVNERAFDVCGEPLFEGDDPVVVNPEILKELMA
jgi:uncharacterized tellurite resistance protein B-like protein